MAAGLPFGWASACGTIRRCINLIVARDRASPRPTIRATCPATSRIRSRSTCASRTPTRWAMSTTRVYLTYCEMARIRYWTDVTGEPIAPGHEGAESLILAEARITYRAPVFHGECVTVETRATRIGRTSFTLEHRLTARQPGGARGSWRRATRCMVRYDYASERPATRCGASSPPSKRSRDGAPTEPSVAGRRRIATAFWPPKPKPSTATVSTRALRAVSGT